MRPRPGLPGPRGSRFLNTRPPAGAKLRPMPAAQVPTYPGHAPAPLVATEFDNVEGVQKSARASAGGEPRSLSWEIQPLGSEFPSESSYCMPAARTNCRRNIGEPGSGSRPRPGRWTATARSTNRAGELLHSETPHRISQTFTTETMRSGSLAWKAMPRGSTKVTRCPPERDSCLPKLLPDLSQRTAGGLVQPPVQFLVRNLGFHPIIDQTPVCLLRKKTPNRCARLVTEFQLLVETGKSCFQRFVQVRRYIT